MKLIEVMKKAEQVLFSSAVRTSTAIASNGLGIGNSSGSSVNQTQVNARDNVPLTWRWEPRRILSLKSLFDTRADIISSYVETLKDSGHPIVGIANELRLDDPILFSHSSSLQLRATLALLISKSIGYPSAIQHSSKEIQKSVEAKQISLSEITELIHTAHILHRTVTVVNTVNPNSPLHQGNKLAVLMGDLLLAKSSRQLSNLRNNRVTELMSQSICDFSESEFIGGRTNINDKSTKFSSKDIAKQFSYNKWLKRAELSLGSLLGHACYCSAIFAGHDKTIQKFAFHLGQKVGIILQMYKDLRVFEEEDGTKMKLSQSFDPLNLAVIFEFDQNACLNSSMYDLQMVFDQIQSNEAGISQARKTLTMMQKDAVRLLHQIEPKTYATDVLCEILETFSS